MASYFISNCTDYLITNQLKFTEMVGKGAESPLGVALMQNQ